MRVFPERFNSGRKRPTLSVGGTIPQAKIPGWIKQRKWAKHQHPSTLMPYAPDAMASSPWWAANVDHEPNSTFPSLRCFCQSNEECNSSRAPLSLHSANGWVYLLGVDQVWEARLVHTREGHYEKSEAGPFLISCFLAPSAQNIEPLQTLDSWAKHSSYPVSYRVSSTQHSNTEQTRRHAKHHLWDFHSGYQLHSPPIYNY